MIYASTPLSFFELLKKCITSYPIIFKNVWPFMLISALLHVIALGVYKANQHLGFAIIILMLLVTIYLFGVMVHIGHTALMGKEANWRESLKIARERYLSLLGAYVVYLGIIIGVVVVDIALISLGEFIQFKIVSVLFTAVAIAFSIFVLFLFYFTLPVILLDKKSVFKGFESSFKLVWGHWWLVVGIFLIIIGILAIIGGLGGFIFGMFSALIAEKQTAQLVIQGIFNFILQILVYPLALSVLLNLLHDLKLRNPTAIS